MGQITWYNHKIYSHSVIENRIKFIKKNMYGLLPLFSNEKQKLLSYAKKHNLPPYEMISLRNTIKIQREIYSGGRVDVKRIEKRFTNLTENLKKHPERSNAKIKYFLESANMPLYPLLKIISKMPEFDVLTDNNIGYIQRIKDMAYDSNVQIQKRSVKFEHVLEDYLISLKIKFRTEDDIKRDGDYTVTPDILFDKPIILELDGMRYKIRWMDAKNYTLTNTPFIIRSLKKQSAKYNNIFGPGAFVFHYGFDQSIDIPNTLILDGSDIEIML